MDPAEHAQLYRLLVNRVNLLRRMLIFESKHSGMYPRVILGRQLGLIVLAVESLSELLEAPILKNRMVTLERGTQIAYMPAHVKSLEDPGVEFGFVTSGPNARGEYACRYWLPGHPGELRTKLNSELTPGHLLVEHVSVEPAVVERALAEYCS